MMVKLIKAKFDGTPIQFNDAGWFNATVAAKTFGKDVNEWIRLPSTVEYVNELGQYLKSGKIPDLIQSKKGRNGGTWLHPDLAVVFARWCDVKFAIWCDRQIKEIIYGKPEQKDWKKLRHEAASSYKVMNNVLKDVRGDQGKETKSFHYANEAKLVNWAMIGEYKSIDREALSPDELDVLAKLESRNSVLIAKGADRELRKEVLYGMAQSLMTKKLGSEL